VITREEIRETLASYRLDSLSIATICSHSALQIFYAARRAGFKTVGIATEERVKAYDAFPLAHPDEYLVVDRLNEAASSEIQEALIERNSIVIPHGSFVEYVGARKILEGFAVPMFGNRLVLEWEGDRGKQKEWLRHAGVKTPKVYRSPEEIDAPVFVKFQGAKGGRGYFVARTPEEFRAKLRRAEKLLGGKAEYHIEEFLAGVRVYPHFFYTPLRRDGYRAGEGRVELLSMDRRLEPVDEACRGLPDLTGLFQDYTVVGNTPLVLRESLLPELLEIGARLVEASVELFPPGMVGPFCVEAVYRPGEGFKVFEVSARIVAGTNLYPNGSPYSCYLFKTPLSTGDRIVLEIKTAAMENRLHEVVY